MKWLGWYGRQSDGLKVLLAVLLVAGVVTAGAALPPLRLYDEGTALAQRFRLNFAGNSVTCSDNSSTSTTTCNVESTPPVPFSTSDRMSFSWQRQIIYTAIAPALTWTCYVTDANNIFTGTSPQMRQGYGCASQTPAVPSQLSVGASTTTYRWELRHGIQACFYAGLQSFENVARAWFSFTTAGNILMAASDTPSYSYVGLRYSRAVGPNWYWCQDTASGAPNCGDTGVIASSDAHLHCIDCSSGLCEYTVDGVGVTGNATKLPTGTVIYPNIAVRNDGAADGGTSGVNHFFSSFSVY